ncbi:MAG: hypothetical protein CMM07_01555 [Rhodopirellula sp.]|nr:hypothetical protein [Rhodopirellula sp.]
MSDDRHSRAIVFIEAIKALAWPTVTLTFLILFYSPVYQLVDNAADRILDVYSLKLGDLELRVRKNDLPIPSNETASVLESFDASMVTELLGISGEGGACFPYENLNNHPRYETLKKLDELNQITFIAEEQTEEWCENPHQIILTESGKDTQSFIVKLIASQIGME